MADDTTQKILEAHAAILDNLAVGQAAIAQGLQAMAGVIQLQQAEGSRTSDILDRLAVGVTLAQANAERHRQASLKKMEEVKAQMAEAARGGGSPR